MFAITPIGVAVFALQAVIGFGVYRYFAAGNDVSAAILGAVAAMAGVVALLAMGLFWAFVFDVVILLASALVGTRFVNTSTPS